ncbi:hypothetical protein GCM10027168_47780 [Streptomyces capparidis]
MVLGGIANRGLPWSLFGRNGLGPTRPVTRAGVPVGRGGAVGAGSGASHRSTGYQRISAQGRTPPTEWRAWAPGVRRETDPW